jgi:hypothetical protein
MGAMARKDPRYFAVLGVGLAQVEVGDRIWPIPDGEVRRIGWELREGGSVSISGPPGTSDEDRRLDAGRPLVTVHLDDSEAAARATAVADAIAGMMASPQSPVPVETSVVPLSADDAAAGVADVGRLRSHLGLFEAATLSNLTAGRGILPPIFDRLDVVLRDGDGELHGLLPALVFWRLAVDEYAFAPDDVQEALDRPEERPVTRVDQARAEQSIQNSYKAFEALIGGQAPKDERKFKFLLSELGIDPSASIRLPDGSPDALIERLSRIWDLRSKRAAHGGPTGVAERAVSWSEVIECHWTIWHCIYTRTEHLLSQHPRPAQPG